MSYCNDIIESQSGNTDDDNISYDDIDDNVDIVELLNEYGITNNNISANNGRAIMRISLSTIRTPFSYYLRSFLKRL